METKFNFKSQICTSREQSKRLLSLGLKGETADMKYLGTREYYGGILTEGTSSLPIIIDTEDDDITEYDTPAWSLHRLIELKQPNTIDNSVVVLPREQTYDKFIEIIAKSIEVGKFPKEYLV